MKTINWLLSLLSTITLLGGCTPPMEVFPDVPRVYSLGYENPSPNSVTFKAVIDNLKGRTVVDHGFIWPGRLEALTKGKDTVSLGPSSSAAEFSATVDWGLLAAGEFVPYLRYNDTLILAAPSPYTSAGSRAPVINGFAEDTVAQGEYITAYGQRLTGQLDKINIRFGNRKALISNTYSDSVRFRVSRDIPPGRYQIQVTVLDQTITSSMSFQVVE